MSKINTCEKCGKMFRIKRLPDVYVQIKGKDIILCHTCQMEIERLVKNIKETVYE